MSQALFFVLTATASENSDPVLLLACQLAQQAYENKQLVYIHCDDQQQAHDIDEQLWQFDPAAFVPHNLKGEGPNTGAPVEIGFDRIGPNKSRYLLINLADQAPSFAVKFGQIFDFVANDEQRKMKARDRYRQYQALGLSLTTQNLATNPLKTV